MAQQDETPDVDVEEFISSVDFAEEEIADLRKKENQRHERKMNEIEEKKTRYRNEMYEKAGLDAVGAKHDDLINLTDEIKSVRKDLRSRIYNLITKHLDGGYNKEITVKNGRVYRYGKKKNAHIEFFPLVSGSYRPHLDSALDTDAPPEVAEQIKDALDLISDRLNNSSNPSFTASRTGLGLVHPYSSSTFSNPEETIFDGLTVSYSLRRKQYGYRAYITIEDDPDARHNNDLMCKPDTRSPDDMKWLVKARDDVLPLMDEIENQMQRMLEDYQTVYERIDADLPDPEE